MSTSSHQNFYHYEGINTPGSSSQDHVTPNTTLSNQSVGTSVGTSVGAPESLLPIPPHHHLQMKGKNYAFNESSFNTFQPIYHNTPPQECYNSEFLITSAAPSAPAHLHMDSANPTFHADSGQSQYQLTSQFPLTNPIVVPPQHTLGPAATLPQGPAVAMKSAVNNTKSIPDLQSKDQVRHVKPRVFTTFWEDQKTVCYQVEAHGILVSRREDTNYINGTKLLNVAGMTRGKRDGILKTERTKSVVKVGTMNLKGVWIPFERAAEIARNDGIDGLLYPLFVKDLKTFFKDKGSTLTNDNYIRTMENDDYADLLSTNIEL